MKQILFVIVNISLLFLLSSSGMAMTAKEIMQKVNQLEQESYSSMAQRVKLSTCRYGKKKKKIVCVEKPRVKVVESVQKNTGEAEKDSKAVSIIQKPIAEKGVGMLSYSYDDPDRNSDNWLYLSALGKVKRLVSGNSEDNSDSGSFFGTEFSIEDMDKRKTGDFLYKILKETTYRKKKVWVIESIPTNEKLKKSKYGKTISWVDQDKFIILKVNLYDKKDQLRKILTMKNINKINDIWIARSLMMNNLHSKRVTNMKIVAIAFNVDVKESFLTKRTLTDFSFREREMTKLRKYLK